MMWGRCGLPQLASWVEVWGCVGAQCVMGIMVGRVDSRALTVVRRGSVDDVATHNEQVAYLRMQDGGRCIIRAQRVSSAESPATCRRRYEGRNNAHRELRRLSIIPIQSRHRAIVVSCDYAALTRRRGSRKRKRVGCSLR